MKRKNILIIFLIIVGMGIIGGSWGLYLFFKKHRDLATVKPDYTLSAAALCNDFQNDEDGASKKYIDKVIQVTGPVASVELGSDSTVNVTLSSPGAMSGVICSFQGRKVEDIDVKKGETAVIRGQCSGELLDVLLNNCALISKVKQP